MHDSPLNPPRWRLAMLADELTGPLRQLRIAMRAQEALIVYAPHRSTTRVIASDPHTEPAFLPEEPVHMAVRWRKAPWTEQRLRVTSAMRLLAVDFDRALALPFADSRGRGLVILGSAAPVDDAALATVQRFAREIDAQRSRIDQTRHRDIDRAYRVVARAATSDLSLERVFDITLAAARDLLDGDVAYLSLPVDDDYFAFTRTLGIQTGKFRDLRVGLGEGLGTPSARSTTKPIPIFARLPGKRHAARVSIPRWRLRCTTTATWKPCSTSPAGDHGHTARTMNGSWQISQTRQCWDSTDLISTKAARKWSGNRNAPDWHKHCTMTSCGG
jgi:hypothetical protein